MRLRFTKMHGAGNDFVMLDAVTQKISLSAERIRKLADRHFGVGCDQVLIVEPPRSSDADFRYRIFNCDGSEVENCGNGARCFAIFVRHRGLTAKKVIRVETAAGDLILTVNDDDRVTVDMGNPILEPAKIPFVAEATASDTTTTHPLQVDEKTFDITAVSMGNPHCVTFVDDVSNFPVEHYGPLIEKHPQFPRKVNAGFLQIIDRSNAKLRVYERGAGETLACGTGACAAMVAARLSGLVDDHVNISLPGGTLTLNWGGEGKPVMMTGPATIVFHGQINI